MQTGVRTCGFVSSLLISSAAMAGPVTIPTTFSSGTPAMAAEVNGNFTAVKTAVDDNDGRITTNASDISANAANITANTNAISGIGSIGVFVKGVRVGSLLQYPGAFDPITILLPSNYLAVISSNGEGLSPASSSGANHEILYLSNDCSGQAYVNGTSLETFVLYGQGQLYANQGLAPLTYYYIPAGTPAESLTYNSKNIGFGCVSESATVELYKTFLNDPNVTGVTASGSEFMGSATIGN